MSVYSVSEPTPSDFGKYVYCGIQWAYSKAIWLKEKRKPFADYDLPNETGASLERQSEQEGKSLREIIQELNRKNERKCIEFIQSEYSIEESNILFNGTNDDGENLDAVIGTRTIKAKPDLIIIKDNKVILFEFKSVSNEQYLNMKAFNSDLAQLWCYTQITDGSLKPEGFNLLRYHILDPSLRKIINYDSNELENDRFDILFSQYLETIETLKGLTNENLSDVKYKIPFNHPDENERSKKCYRCYFNNACSVSPKIKKKYINDLF